MLCEATYQVQKNALERCGYVGEQHFRCFIFVSAASMVECVECREDRLSVSLFFGSVLMGGSFLHKGVDLHLVQKTSAQGHEWAVQAFQRHFPVMHQKQVSK